MPKKILVTKEWHSKAMVAIEKAKRIDAISDPNLESIRLAWMSYMENCLDDSVMDDFIEYCEKYKKEFGFKLE